MTANEHNTDRNLDKYSIKRTLDKKDILKYPQTTLLNVHYIYKDNKVASNFRRKEKRGLKSVVIDVV